MEIAITAFLLAERNMKVNHFLEEPNKKEKKTGLKLIISIFFEAQR